MARPEIFHIPFEGKNIIYAPLKNLAFIGNEALSSLVEELAEGRKPRNGSVTTREAVKFIEDTGLLSPDFIPPYNANTFNYQPISTTLFLTNRCNLRCIYCYASSGEYMPTDMSAELAIQAIDIVSGNAIALGLPSFEVGFHGGGEPTLNWDVLTKAVSHARKKSIKADISASSNGCLNKKQLDYILANFDGLSLSFDGPAQIQNIQRPFANGRPSFQKVMKAIEAMDSQSFPYSIRMTVTSASVNRLPDALEFLTNNTNVKHVQVEPVFPRGRGRNISFGGKAINSFIQSFWDAYTIAESRGVHLFYSGARPDILITHFCTAPCNALVVLQNGQISTCFEVHNIQHPLARDFIFGHIKDQELYFDEKQWLKVANRTVEKIPYCQDCFCKFHCAGDCLSKTYDSDKESRFKASPRCTINRELTKRLILKKIAQGSGILMAKS